MRVLQVNLEDTEGICSIQTRAGDLDSQRNVEVTQMMWTFASRYVQVGSKARNIIRVGYEHKGHSKMKGGIDKSITNDKRARVRPPDQETLH